VLSSHLTGVVIPVVAAGTRVDGLAARVVEAWEEVTGGESAEPCGGGVLGVVVAGAGANREAIECSSGEPAPLRCPAPS
jgi:hypothetical protein